MSSNSPLWSGTLSGPQQLAGVIQGEAGSNPANQFAVASVMYNRTQSSDFGGNTIQSVVTPNNFLGYTSSPNSSAQSLANDLWSGNAPQGGSTGNATYFVSPLSGNSYGGVQGATGPATAGILGGGNSIGGNYYSDKWGAPSSNFQAPQYGGDTSAGIATTGVGGDTSSLPSASNSGMATDPSTGSAFSGTPLSSIGVGGGSGTANLAGSNLSGGGQNTPLDTTSGAIPDQTMGVPLYLTDPSSVGAIAGKAAQSGLNTLNTGIQKDTSALTTNLTQDVATSTTAGTSWLQSIQNTIFDTFPRIITGFGALILIGMGIWLVGKERRS